MLRVASKTVGVRAWAARFVVVAVTCLVGATAHAKTKIMVFPVVPIPGEVEPKVADEMTKAMVEELRQGEDLQIIVGRDPTLADAPAPAQARRPAKTDAEIKAAIESFESGKQQVKKLRFPTAIAALKKSLEGMERNLELLDSYDRLVEAHLLLAVAYFSRGKESSGTDVLEALARLRPGLELDAQQYPPLFVRVFEEARGRALRRTRGSLRVTSAPIGAEVFLNGERMGQAPVTIESIVPGQNHLVVKGGDAAWSSVVEVREGKLIDEHADLGAGGPPPQAGGSMSDAIAQNRFDREVRRAARAAAKDGGADYALVSAMGMGDRLFTVGAFLGSVKAGKWTALDPLAPDVDMLSAGVEGTKLTRDVTAQLQAFKSPVVDDTIQFIAGKQLAAAGGKAKGPVRESKAVFVTAAIDAKAASASLGEGEAVAAGAVAAGAARAPVQPADATGGSTREPIGASREPVGASREPVGASREPVGAGVAAAAPAPHRPLTRESAAAREPAPPPPPPPVTVAPSQPAAAVPPPAQPPEPPLEAPPPGPRRAPATREAPRGPVVRDETGADRELVGMPVAAVSPELASPASDLQAEAALHSDPFWNKWWFWTAVGVGAVGLSAGGWYFLIHDRPVQSVEVHAVWQ